MVADVHHVSPMTKVMTSYAANRDLKRDSSASHIAEMMISIDALILELSGISGVSGLQLISIE